MPMPSGPVTPAVVSGANLIAQIRMDCRGVSRVDLSPSANSDMAYAVQQGLTNSQYFTIPITLERLSQDTDTNTFTFTVTATLKHPFKL
jgi:hypothetical protein